MSQPMLDDLSPNPVLTRYVMDVLVAANQGFLQDALAPIRPVDNRAYEYPYYDAGRLSAHIETQVSESGSPNTLEGRVPELKTGRTVRHGLKQDIDREQRIGTMSGGEPLATSESALTDIVLNLRLGRESKVKAILDTRVAVSGHYATPSVKWDAASGVTIQKNWDDGVIAFIKKFGTGPTDAVIPTAISKVMARDADVQNLRRYTDPSLLIDGTLPPRLWGVPRIHIPGAVNNTANPGAATSLDFIWATNTVYFLYVNPAIAQRRTITAMSTSVWTRWGAPYQAYLWNDPEPMTGKQWVGSDIHYTVDENCANAIYGLTDVLT